MEQSLPIILCTDTSDYALEYLCQVQQRPDAITYEQPIRFLSGTFAGVQIVHHCERSICRLLDA